MNGAKSGLLLAAALLPAGGAGIGSAQPKPFEGEIHYRIEVRSTDPKIPHDLLQRTFGTGYTLVYKDGDSKQTIEGGKVDSVWYRWKENREYTLMTGESYLRVSDASESIEEARSVETHHGNDELLGYRLSRFVIRYDGDVQATYWWAPEIAVDPEWVRRNHVVRQDLFFAESKALPLMYERKLPGYARKEVATKIVWRAVSDEELALPEMPREPVNEVMSAAPIPSMGPVPRHGDR